MDKQNSEKITLNRRIPHFLMTVIGFLKLSAHPVRNNSNKHPWSLATREENSLCEAFFFVYGHLLI